MSTVLRASSNFLVFHDLNYKVVLKLLRQILYWPSASKVQLSFYLRLVKRSLNQKFLPLHKKCNFPLRIFLGSVTKTNFIEKIMNKKLLILCSVKCDHVYNDHGHFFSRSFLCYSFNV